MDDILKELKDYLNSPFANMKGVCHILSKDNNAINYVLDMLQNERKE